MPNLQYEQGRKASARFYELKRFFIMNELLIDEETGEIIPANVMVKAETVPSIILDVKEVDKNFNEPMKLVEMINKQAGFCIFDIKTKKGQDECRSHAAKIIRCIAPVIKRYKELEEDAQKIVNQGRNARKIFESGVREIAEYHRKPLTEWEEEQERIAEQERIFAEKMESMRLYQLDWDDAIAYDELFTLRKEKAARDAEADALKQLQEQEEYEKQLQAQAIIKERERHVQEIEKLKQEQEAQRLKIQQEEEAKAKRKAEAEQAEKLESERKKMRDEWNARIAEENRLEREKQANIEELERPLRDKEEKIIEFIEEEKKILSYPVIISKTEYLILKSDSARLREIIKLWQQSNRMTESANRADKSSARNEELRDAQKIRNEAIKLIES